MGDIKNMKTKSKLYDVVITLSAQAIIERIAGNYELAKLLEECSDKIAEAQKKFKI